jgi:hypothetical protein
VLSQACSEATILARGDLLEAVGVVHLQQAALVDGEALPADAAVVLLPEGHVAREPVAVPDRAAVEARHGHRERDHVPGPEVVIEQRERGEVGAVLDNENRRRDAPADHGKSGDPDQEDPEAARHCPN